MLQRKFILLTNATYPHLFSTDPFFTPYRKLEDGEKPQRPIAACKIGSLSETKNCYILRLTFAKTTTRRYLIEEFIKLIAKL